MKRAIACALAAALSGCAMVGPDYRRPAVELPGAYSEAAPAQTAALAVPADWWKTYNDPLLNDLVAAGLAGNSDVRLAAARVEEAEAALREANALFFPEIDGSATAGRSRVSTRTGIVPASIPAIRTNYALTATTTFELDFWGRLRRAAEAARAQYFATQYGRDIVALTLAAGVAQTYFAVRSLDAQILVSQETLQAADESLDIARKRFQAGLVSELDVNQAAANRAQLAAQITDLKRQRATAVHQIGVLTGRLDVKLDAGDLRALPTPPLPPAGLPSTLLERRPDVRQAESQLAAATALIGVARAAQFPTFSLTGSLGRQSKELETLFNAGGGLWNIGLNIAGPIFDAGRYAARTQQAEARAHQAAATYEKTARTAFREVSDALSNVGYAADAEKDLQERVDQARNSLKLATMRYDS
ncbi:MAG TPA: efflux transporter outer membrane subunit, partial [Burkholderiales bacterium]|nr:efflux transporter outer membrane subunit [Burkholderiales bacterium]